jgi:hypothetical protein
MIPFFRNMGHSQRTRVLPKISREPQKKDFLLSLGFGRIEFCEALRRAGIALFRDSLAFGKRNISVGHRAAPLIAFSVPTWKAPSLSLTEMPLHLRPKRQKAFRPA